MSLDEMRRELREKFEKLKSRGNPTRNREKCFRCISKLVKLVEVPHMIFRSYDNRELVDWYLSLLEKKPREMADEGCLKEETIKEVSNFTKKLEKEIKPREAQEKVEKLAGNRGLTREEATERLFMWGEITEHEAKELYSKWLREGVWEKVPEEKTKEKVYELTEAILGTLKSWGTRDVADKCEVEIK